MKNAYNFKRAFIFSLLMMAGVTVIGQVLSTDYIINITSTTATAGYTVTSGGTYATGVCVGTSLNPVANGTDMVFPGLTGTGLQEVSITGLLANTVYHARAYALNNGGSYVYGMDLQFQTYPSGTGTYPYQCSVMNDYLTDPNTLQFEIWIYSVDALNPLYLNNFQLGLEVNNIGFAAGTITGTTISSGLPVGFQPATNLIVRVDGDHFDMVIPGPAPSSNGTLIPASPGIRIGTFQVVHHSTPGGPATPYPTGVQLAVVADFDVLGKTVIYATPGLTGTPVNSTLSSSHAPHEPILNNNFYPENNYACNAANWKGTTDVNWGTATNWFANPSTIATPPSSTTCALIPGNIPVNYPVVSTRSTPACGDLYLLNGASLTIASNGDLTVGGTIYNTAGTSGLVIQSASTGAGSLIHNTNNVNATLQRYVDGSGTLTDMKYHFVSIPVTSAASPTSNLFLSSYLFNFSESANTWVSMGNSTTTPLDPTQGYMTYYPGPGTTYTYSGPMNNGLFTALTGFTTGNGFNLVPNPYPSAIDWSSATGWTKTNIDDAVYQWNSGTSITNYATYINGASVNGGSRYIAFGQSFFVHANAAAPLLSMDNTVRLHNTTPFLKETATMPNLLLIKSVVNGSSDELIVRFAEGATSGFDGTWDAYKLQGGANAPQFSSLASDNSSLCINTFPVTGGNIIVPLNFSYNSNAEVTFTATGLDSFTKNGPIYLEDHVLDKVINLRQNPVYSFNYQTNNPVNRFSLNFSGINGTGNVQEDLSRAFISNGRIYIDAPSMNGQDAEIRIYNLIGQKIISNDRIINGIVSFKAPENEGIFIVDVATADQHFVTKVVNK